MARTAAPRFSVPVTLYVEISANSTDDALERIAAVREFVEDRLDRTTFTRLPGRPSLTYVEATEPSYA